MDKNNVKSKNSHHHGNLHQALVEAGIELLDEGGIAALTLRKCAARAGVSHAAPAHHFRGLKGLLTAIVTKGYILFAAEMTREIDAAKPDPMSRLRGCCKGYVNFSRHHKALASIIFNKANCYEDEPEWIEAADAAYQVLIDICAPFKHRHDNAELTQIAVWTMLEGYVNFERNEVINNDHRHSKQLHIDLLIDMLNLEVAD
ncbi:MAG: TetR/AcrR family transcriptional regulator [Alphaproteobacteria bacterium]|nr:TetR/AcrR family transcriptional regulator [Alphaproteobacteria bacterium]